MESISHLAIFLFFTLSLVCHSLGQNEDLVEGFWNPTELVLNTTTGVQVPDYQTVTYILPNCSTYDFSTQEDLVFDIPRENGAAYQSVGLRFEPLFSFETVEVDVWMRTTGVLQPGSDIGLATTSFPDVPEPDININLLGFEVTRRDSGEDVLAVYSFPSVGPTPRGPASVVLPFDAAAGFHRYNFYFQSLPERENGYMEVRVDGEMVVSHCRFQPFRVPGDIRILSHCGTRFCSDALTNCSMCPGGTTSLRNLTINGVAVPTCLGREDFQGQFPDTPRKPAARAHLTQSFFDSKCSEDSFPAYAIALIIVLVCSVVCGCLLVICWYRQEKRHS